MMVNPRPVELVNHVHRFISKHHLVKQGDRVVLAVSGGSDSVALLRLFSILKKNLKLQLFLAHVNHGLRGRESRRDEAFVRMLAAKEDIPLEVMTVSPREHTRGISSLEERARILRYGALREAARRFKAGKIATGHHLDDQAETVLMRLIRGTGLRGVRSIAPARNEGRITLIRPLLLVTKKELVDFLKIQKISYRKDASNQDTAYFRNRLRHRLFPLIERQFNARFKRHLVELSWDAVEADDFIAARTKALMPRLTSCSAREMRIRLQPFRKVHPVLQRGVVFRAMEKTAGSRRSLDRVHVESILHLSGLPDGSELYLPRRMRARVRGPFLSIQRRD